MTQGSYAASLLLFVVTCEGPAPKHGPQPMKANEDRCDSVRTVVERLAGPDPVDCGLLSASPSDFDRLEGWFQQGWDQARAIGNCGREAIASGKDYFFIKQGFKSGLGDQEDTVTIGFADGRGDTLLSYGSIPIVPGLYAAAPDIVHGMYWRECEHPPKNESFFCDYGPPQWECVRGKRISPPREVDELQPLVGSWL